jgi:hypothetical protein
MVDRYIREPSDEANRFHRLNSALRLKAKNVGIDRAQSGCTEKRAVHCTSVQKNYPDA